jgi:hypothetical protein
MDWHDVTGWDRPDEAVETDLGCIAQEQGDLIWRPDIELIHAAGWALLGRMGPVLGEHGVFARIIVFPGPDVSESNHG